MIKCAVEWCLSSSKEGRTFYQFPDDENRVKQWIEAVHRPDLQDRTAESLNMSYVICDLHFEKKYQLTERSLSYDAIPKLFLCNQSALDSLLNKSVQTDKYDYLKQLSKEIALVTEIPSASFTLDPSDETGNNYDDCSKEPPQKKKKTNDTMNLSTEKVSIEEIKNLLKRKRLELQTQPVLPKLINFQNQLKVAKRNKKLLKGLRLSILNVYLANPSAYTLFRKTFNLPCETALQDINIDIGTNLNSDTFECLESKFKNFKPLDKFCTLCAGVIPLKPNLYYQINKDKIIGFQEINDLQTPEPATSALVIMARGVYSKWKQPLAYCFLAENKYKKIIKAWLYQMIAKILNVGLIVVAFVSDHSPIFYNLANEINVSVKRPFFFINEIRVYYIFDISQLVLSLRDDLLECDFGFLGADETEMTAKWEHIAALYKHDCKKTHRLAPLLTQSHIRPDEHEKLNIGYATQVFNKTVTAALNFLIECGQLEGNALGTVELIDLVSKTLAVLNSSAVKNYCAQQKLEELNTFEQFLENVIIINKRNENVTVTAKYLDCWKITIESVIRLSRNLQADGFPFLLTSRLNQSVLKNTFNKAEQLNALNGDLQRQTPIQFLKAFKGLFMENLLRFSEANYSENLDELVLKINNMNNTTDTNDNASTLCSKVTIDDGYIPISTTDYRFSLNEDGLVCLSQHLLNKCFDFHKCEEMIKFQQSKSQPQDLVSCVKAMDARFKCFFQYIIGKPVANEILKGMSDILVLGGCKCFPNNYFKNLFVRFRIYNTLRYNNHRFKGNKTRFYVNCI